MTREVSMTIWEEREIIVSPDGTSEYRADRVRRETDGSTRRMKIVRRTVPSTALFAEHAAVSVLPINCRYVVPPWYIIEEPPCVRTVTWEYVCDGWNSVIRRGVLRKYGLTAHDEHRRRFQLAFPYTIFLLPITSYQHVFSLGDCYIAFRSEPLRSLDDDLYWSIFTNQRNENGFLCLGNNRPTSHNTAHGMAEMLVAHWWNSNFNQHWPERFNAYQKQIPQFCTLWDWEYHSRKGPAWTCEVDWTPMGMTLRQKIGAEKSERTLTFDKLSRRAQAAPAVVLGGHLNKPPKQNDQDREAILIAGIVIQVGDIFRHDHKKCTRNDFVHDKLYKLIRIDQAGCLYFDGVARPISCYDLFSFFYRDNATARNEYTVGSHCIRVGMKFEVTDSTDLSFLRRGQVLAILAIQADAEGDLCVRLHGYDGWFYLTYEGGKLLPSVKFLIPVLKDGTFTYGRTTLKIGEIIHVTKGPNELVDQTVEVAELEKKETHYLVRFNTYNTSIDLFAEDRFLLGWSTVTYTLSERCVQMNNCVLDLNACDHLLCILTDTPLSCGHVYRMRRLIRSERIGAHPFDVDLELEQTNEPIPVIKKSKWTFPYLYLSVCMRYEDDSLTLNAGDVLKPDQRTILCFSPEGNGKVNVIFTNGQMTTLTQALLLSANFSPSDIRRLPYENSRTKTLFSLSITRPIDLSLHPKNLQTAIAQRKDLKGFGTQVGTDQKGIPIHIGDVVQITQIKFMPNREWGHMHNEHVGNHALIVHPHSPTISVYLYLGKIICNEYVENIHPDMNGYQEMDPAYQARNTREEMAVSECRYLLNVTEQWCPPIPSLPPIGSRVHIRQDVTLRYGRGSVGAAEAGVVIAQLHDSQEIVAQFPSEPEWIGCADEVLICPFTIGQSVFVKPGHRPRYLMGKVVPGPSGDQGTVRAFLDPETILVDFPNHPSWFGHVTDLAAVTNT